jgi:replicative DNA helicase
MAFTRKIVDSTIERQIILAMILSKRYLSQVVSAIRDSEFECFVNDYARTVARWVVDYYDQYKKAPEFEIERIYAINKPSLSKEEAELISSFLTRLSNEYVEGQTINEEYIFDNTKEYFERRNLVLKANKVLSLVDMNNVPEAKMVFEKKTLLGKAQGRQSVFTWEAFHNAYDNHTSTVFTLPGALGSMIGDVQRGWLVGILGAFKRGKSFTMQEFALAALTQRRKVVFYSLEMSMADLHKRFYTRITGGGDNREGTFFFPVFDCLKNQTGVCTSPLRKNQIVLRNSAKDELKYIPEYSPCEACRKENPQDFLADTYFKKIELKKKSHKKMFKEIQSFETMYGDNIQFQVYPRFAASVDDIREDLDMLENQDDFIPDVIVVDYADILKPGRSLYKGEPRHAIDDIWKNLAGLAAERHCVVITASQGNRGSLKKYQMEGSDLAEWIGKLAHVDVFLALNQTPEEKDIGIIRFNILAHRHKEFNPLDEVIVLQHMKTGQAHLDSEYAPRSYKRKQEN